MGEHKFNLIWMQGQTCDGNSMSVINSTKPDFFTFLEQNNINLLYMPTISPPFGKDAQALFADCLSGKTPVQIFIFEGAVPTKEGFGDYFGGRDVRTMVKNFAEQAMLTIGIGACACWGGIPNTPPNESGATGLQWDHYEKGGLLGKDYASQIGMPVVNVPGCPAHADWLLLTLQSFVNGKAIELDEYNRPLEFFKEKVHRGCSLCEFNDYNLMAKNYTDVGCLEHDLGCKGKDVGGDCNIRLWMDVSSCTRSGSQCIGCTDPGFPSSMMPFEKPHHKHHPETLKKEVKERKNINKGGD